MHPTAFESLVFQHYNRQLLDERVVARAVEESRSRKRQRTALL